ncbi:MAG: S-adenosyl-methyltransferase MraW [Acidobacteria bacterium OLB17]|nr:MAG: S-adenosyl-methyltransferase MraW [Acidobacteria bacterium OLB17]MCZ2391890.1 16S rRNA (cytosine(1402)-N(4))-methyltransferase RsmH [Acidobacteriota bacterium]
MQSSSAEFTHQTVLRDEVVEFVRKGSGAVVIDATLGLGGHSEAILRSTEFDVIGLDQDAKAVEMAKARLAEFGGRFRAVNTNFEAIADIDAGDGVAAIVADLGVSSMQLDDAARGFSFNAPAELDMRMNRGSGQSAAELLANSTEAEIADILYYYGEERKSRRIARWITERNEAGDPIKTTDDLASLVERAVGRRPGAKIHPATRTFQAIRIAVNRELDVLKAFVPAAIEKLNEGGILAIISFHSLEDRIVKQAFQRLSGKCSCPPRIPKCICGAEKKIEILTKKPIVPSDDEQKKNKRSRSSKLRVARRIGS